MNPGTNEAPPPHAVLIQMGTAHWVSRILFVAAQLGSDWVNKGFENLLYSLQTGKSGVEKALGMPIFDYLGKHPDEASLFSETMVGFHGAEPAAVASAYDFSGLSTIVDVGGATGNL